MTRIDYGEREKKLEMEIVELRVLCGVIAIFTLKTCGF